MSEERGQDGPPPPAPARAEMGLHGAPWCIGMGHGDPPGCGAARRNGRAGSGFCTMREHPVMCERCRARAVPACSAMAGIRIDSGSPIESCPRRPGPGWPASCLLVDVHVRGLSLHAQVVSSIVWKDGLAPGPAMGPGSFSWCARRAACAPGGQGGAGRTTISKRPRRTSGTRNSTRCGRIRSPLWRGRPCSGWVARAREPKHAQRAPRGPGSVAPRSCARSGEAAARAAAPAPAGRAESRGRPAAVPPARRRR